MAVFNEMMCSDGLVMDHKLCRIVFLNKVDVFQEKIRDEKKWVEFKTVMGYTGARSVVECTKFIEQKIRELNNNLSEKHKEDMELKVHITNSLDTTLMSKVTKDIKNSIVSYALNNLGLFNGNM